MQTVDILQGISGSELVVLAGKPDGDVDVLAVTVIDSWAQVRDCSPGDLIVVPHYFTSSVSGFELDTVVRYAADAGAAGFVFQQGARLPVTVDHLVRRTGLTIFGFSGFSGDNSLVDIVHQLDALFGAGEPSALLRATRAISTIRSLENARDFETIVDATSKVLGSSINVEWLAPAGRTGETILVDGVSCGIMNAGNPNDAAVRIVLPYLARVVGDVFARSLVAARRATERLNKTLRISRQAALDSPDGDISYRDDTTVRVACFLSGRPHDPDAVDFAPQLRAWETVAQVAVDRLRERTREFSLKVGIRGEAIVVVIGQAQNTSSGGDEPLPPAVLSALSYILDGLNLRTDDSFSCGVGSDAIGLPGLLISASQAMTSAYAARTRPVGEILVADAGRLDNLLAHALDSPLSRQAAASILAPFENLPPAALEATVRTLAAYFDHQGSNARAAARLHLHPNAVGYRVKKALALVPEAWKDPDSRLALHLACRLWLMGRDNANPGTTTA